MPLNPLASPELSLQSNLCNTWRMETAARLKALAHPLRLQLLALLRAYGPATATELARRIGEVTSGTTSYHLRRLADHGYVREVAERRSARDRCWQAADATTTFDAAELLADPNTRGALETLRAEVLTLQLDWLRAWLQQAADADPAWVRASTFSDHLLRLTPARLAALVSDLDQVLDGYQQEAAPATDDQRLVTVLFHAFPRMDLDGDIRPASGSSGP
jgi:DNA-binding transcriptional ArsR family regulator